MGCRQATVPAIRQQHRLRTRTPGILTRRRQEEILPLRRTLPATILPARPTPPQPILRPTLPPRHPRRIPRRQAQTNPEPRHLRRAPTILPCSVLAKPCRASKAKERPSRPRTSRTEVDARSLSSSALCNFVVIPT